MSGTSSEAGWWLHAALASVVLGLVVGILGMHALTSSHGVHGAVTAASDPARDSMLAPSPGSSDGGDQASPGSGMPQAVPAGSSDPMTSRTAPGRKGSCDPSVGAMCLAVIGALLSLVLARRYRHLGTPRRGPDTFRVSTPPRWRPGPAPPPTLLCVSRT